MLGIVEQGEEAVAQPLGGESGAILQVGAQAGIWVQGVAVTQDWLLDSKPARGTQPGRFSS